MANNNKSLSWTTEKRKLSDLIPYEHNPRQLTEKQHEDLKRSLEKFGLAEIPAINTDHKIIAGHQRIKILSEVFPPDYEIDVRIPSRKLTEKEFQEYNVRSNKNSGEWDFDTLANSFELNDLLDWGFEQKELDFSTIPDAGGPGPFSDPGIEAKNQYGVIVVCENEAAQESAYRELTNMGYNCKIVVT